MSKSELEVVKSNLKQLVIENDEILANDILHGNNIEIRKNRDGLVIYSVRKRISVAERKINTAAVHK